MQTQDWPKLRPCSLQQKIQLVEPNQEPEEVAIRPKDQKWDVKMQKDAKGEKRQQNSTNILQTQLENHLSTDPDPAI